MNNWKTVKLGDVLRRADRFEEKDELTEYRFAGTFSFGRGIFVGETKSGSTFRLPKIQRVKSGDFIYCKIMAWEGAFGVAPPDVDGCVLSGAFVVYEIDKELLDPKYLDYYFKIKSVWKQIGSQSTGTNVRRRSLHPDQFEIAEIPLPPLSEQRRIVAKIEQLAAKIEDARGLRQRTDEARNTFIAAVTTEIFQKLNGFSRVRIGELGENNENPIQIGPFGAQLHKSEFTETGVPVLNVGNVWPEGLRLDRLDHVTSEKASKLKRYSLKADDLLFARSGATLGKVCIVPKECDGWLMTGHLFRVRFDQQRCDPWFAFAALRGARKVRDQVFDQVRGATRPGFNTTLLSNVELPVPPLFEQRRIVAYLDGLQAQVDRLKALQAQTAAELEALLPSILDRAFEGEL